MYRALMVGLPDTSLVAQGRMELVLQHVTEEVSQVFCVVCHVEERARVTQITVVALHPSGDGNPLKNKYIVSRILDP